MGDEWGLESNTAPQIEWVIHLDTSEIKARFLFEYNLHLQFGLASSLFFVWQERSMVNWIEGFGWIGTRFGFCTRQICMIQKYTNQTTCYRYDQMLRVFWMCKSMCKSNVAACSANVLDAASRASALQESLRKKEIEVRSYNCEREKMLEWMKMVSRFGKIHTARF